MVLHERKYVSTKKVKIIQILVIFFNGINIFNDYSKLKYNINNNIYAKTFVSSIEQFYSSHLV